MITREIEPEIEARLHKGKAIIVMGARQVGKTTLLQNVAGKADPNHIWLNCDDADVREKLTGATSTQLKNLIGKNKFLVIDEAQRVKNIGITLKLITDNIKDCILCVSGSSSFDLANQINEPLTGRKYEFLLYPLSVQELKNSTSQLEETRLLHQRVIYGMYPDAALNVPSAEIILKNLSGSYLYKDVLAWRNIRKPELLEKLLIALALQIGREVSYRELSAHIGADKETVESYVDLLEKCFVIYRLMPFSRNLRNEMVKMRKIYFYDNGIRNAIINNFTPLELRDDTGALWENFVVTERLKRLNNKMIYANKYFWRSHARQEVDYVEEKDGTIEATEIKWKPKPGYRFPKLFMETYKPGATHLISRENYMDFLTDLP